MALALESMDAGIKQPFMRKIAVQNYDPFWNAIELVVFDVDGTLYAQRPLRIRMLGALFLHTLTSGSLETIKVLKHFRQIREELGNEGTQNFESTLLERTSRITGSPPEKVAQIVQEWIEIRPLAYLKACRYPGVTQVFQSLRSRGIKIGVFSDYPASQKLKTMDLEADFVVSAEDKAVGVLKPNPRGLMVLMERAQIPPSKTLMIGDRIDRDGEAAQRAGTLSLIRCSKSIPGWACFQSYEQGPFSLFETHRANPMKNLAVWIILALMLVSLSLGIVIMTVLQR